MAKEIKRRDFLRIAGTTALAVSAAGLLGSCGGDAPSASGSQPSSSSSQPGSSGSEAPSSSSSSATGDLPDAETRRKMVLLAIENARRTYKMEMPEELARLNGYAEQMLAYVQKNGSASNFRYESPFRNGTKLYKVRGISLVDPYSVKAFTQSGLNAFFKSNYDRNFGKAQETWTQDAKELAQAVYVGAATLVYEDEDKIAWCVFYAVPYDDSVSTDDSDLILQAMNKARNKLGWGSDAVRVQELDALAKENLTQYLETKKSEDLYGRIVTAADGTRYKVSGETTSAPQLFTMEMIESDIYSNLESGGEYFRPLRTHVGIYATEKNGQKWYDIVFASKV